MVIYLHAGKNKKTHSQHLEQDKLYILKLTKKKQTGWIIRVDTQKRVTLTFLRVVAESVLVRLVLAARVQGVAFQLAFLQLPQLLCFLMQFYYWNLTK